MDHSFDLWHWHFISEEALSLKTRHIDGKLQLCCLGFPGDVGAEWAENSVEMWNTECRAHTHIDERTPRGQAVLEQRDGKWA